jgi:hypothetical protein
MARRTAMPCAAYKHTPSLSIPYQTGAGFVVESIEWEDHKS